MRARYTVVFEKDEDGWFVASVPALGCAAQGRSRASAFKALQEAVDSFIRARRARGWTVPRESEASIAKLEIAL